ncbi:MAG: hypothetical protein LQ343_003745 [Gyalolechia ehrenbergii]|nr:MAG: hypothetical protein LQ343_003745 [Gyalolechia ehrenbergii]
MAAETANRFACIPGDRNDPLPSSSAFGTPVHPIGRKPTSDAATPSVLPISLPPATLRPLAFRTFTKKHNLTLTSTALQAIATFIGTHCGSGWREEGLAERVLDETAKVWKKNGGGVIVLGEGSDLANVLRNIEGCMVGGRVVPQRALSQQASLRSEQGLSTITYARPDSLSRDDSQSSLGLTTLELEDAEEDQHTKDPRQWLRIVDAFEQPHLTYNASQKQFDSTSKRVSLFPDPSRRIALLRDRYQLVHQRLLRNEAFQTSTVALSRSKSLQRSSSEIVMPQQAYKLTPIANLLGRSGSTHVLLGLLGNSPTGTLVLSDLTGSISLDLQHARPVPEDGAWFAPGMMVLAEGLYEEEGSAAGPSLAGDGGVGGTIGGKFHVASVGGPPCERRDLTLGVLGHNKRGGLVAPGGFGWVDFLGVGSERANGPTMRSLEKRTWEGQDLASQLQGRSRMVILGEVNLDSTRTLEALKQVLGIYGAERAEQTPMTFVLIGNFTRHAVLVGGANGGSIEYKEYFDSLASILADFPCILEDSTFVFVPGDNDPWASAFSAGAAAVLPKRGVPEIYTTRVKKAFATANAEANKPTNKQAKGETVWSTNPTRLTLFGPAQELVVFRDDLSGRLRRKGLRFRKIDESKDAQPDLAGPHGEDELQRGQQAASEQEAMGVDRTIENAESAQPGAKAKDSNLPDIPSDLRTARKLVKTILDQGHLSPFPLTDRPILWDYGNPLNLYPLPTALVLMDPEAPSYALTYEGCHAMNPGALVMPGRRGVAQWIEYDARTGRGKIRDVRF